MNVADELSRNQSKVIVAQSSRRHNTYVVTTGSSLLKQSGPCSVLSCRLMASQDITDTRVGERSIPKTQSSLIPHQPRTFQFPKQSFGKKVCLSGQVV